MSLWTPASESNFPFLFFTDLCSFGSICKLILSWFVLAFSQERQLTGIRARVMDCCPQERHTVGICPRCRHLPSDQSLWKRISLWRAATYTWHITMQRAGHTHYHPPPGMHNVMSTPPWPGEVVQPWRWSMRDVQKSLTRMLLKLWTGREKIQSPKTSLILIYNHSTCWSKLFWVTASVLHKG